MKMYCGSGGIALCILNLIIGCRWVVNFTPRPLYPRYSLDRGRGGPQTWWRRENTIIASVGNRTLAFQPI